MKLDRAGEIARSGAAGSVLFDRGYCGFFDSRIDGQPKIIIRTCHDDLATIEMDDRSFVGIEGMKIWIISRRFNVIGAGEIVLFFEKIHLLNYCSKIQKYGLLCDRLREERMGRLLQSYHCKRTSQPMA